MSVTLSILQDKISEHGYSDSADRSFLEAFEGRDQTSVDESALIAAAQASPAAFETLHLRYETRVYRYLRARTSDDEDAADLTQQVFLKALDALPHYREEGSSFGSWLFRIAHNEVASFHRRGHNTLSWESLPEARQSQDHTDPQFVMLRSESFERAQRIIDSLDPDRRELLALRFEAELKLQDIAKVLGKSEGTIKSELYRLLKYLKEQWDEG